MPNSDHRESEILASRAELLMRQGDPDAARSFYAKAAVYEEAALKVVDSDKPRTLGILAVSAIALYYKAGDYDHAKRLASEILSQYELPAFARSQINEMKRKRKGKCECHNFWRSILNIITMTFVCKKCGRIL